MKKNRPFFLLLILAIFCLSLGQAAFAQASQAAAISVIINGNRLTTDAAPYIRDNRVLVPFRALFEALGATVGWDNVNQVVTGTRNGKEIKLTIDSKTAYVDGKAVELDVPATISSGRTFVPLRFVGESLEAEVSWDEAGQIVKISPGEASPALPAVNVSKSISVKDSLGHYVVVPSPPKRIVVCNSYVAEVICALGEEGRVVGAPRDVYTMPLLNQKLAGVDDVGAIFAPSAEKIIALKPDIVFGWTSQDSNVTAKIQRSGIPVVLLDCSKINRLAKDIMVIGQILQREERANNLVDFINSNLSLVASRVGGLSAGEKPLVYWEGMSDYSTGSADSSDGMLLELAAARNVAADFRIPWPKVSPEWVLAKNPEIIIKCPGTSTVSSGYGQTDDAMKKQWQDIMTRPGWKKTDAVKNGKVYVLSRRAIGGPQAVIGLLYTAKWLHPDLFQDIDPSVIHESMLKEFYGLDYKGAWVCSGE
ncbi:MAG: stalk domain-containing protein [Bacillota bacterium]